MLWLIVVLIVAIIANIVMAKIRPENRWYLPYTIIIVVLFILSGFIL